MPKKPDLIKRGQREKLYNEGLRKNKPFWYYLNKGCLVICGLVGAALLIIVLKHLYPGYLCLTILVFITSFVIMVISRYKLDGGLLKSWWDIY